MGFVQASMLAALAAVILPILAHLLFRRRSRPVDLGTLRFLKIAVRHDTRRRWLKRWLLLALRLGCVVLLVLLFARPFRAEFGGGGDSGLTVLLIDRSASMARKNNDERLIDRAVRKLSDVVAQVPARSRVEAAWFDRKAEPISPSEDSRVSLASMQAPATLTGGTDFAAALSWAAARCSAFRGSGPLAVHILTDLQRTGFGSLEDFTFPKDVPVHVWVELPLTADVEYTIESQDAAGVPAAANRHRIRVTADQSPRVWFDSPTESMEVHTLAEVLMRARARDDFGITKLGIVFQVNNEEERPLVLQESGQQRPREALAEQMLMLEQFLLTQKDCVAYYAFAEDNHPEIPQRATTELRFLDIRPFLRTYRLIDPPEGMPGPQRDLIFLDEVIARQRFNLNQTMRLETHSRARLDLAQVERVAAFENKLATQTHELADFLLGLGVDGAAILSQAEEAMLSAVDSLHEAKFPAAINQERDALRFLMEARETVQQALLKKPRPVRAQARAFDRLQRQKLRRPNEKPETLPQIAGELAKLADEEDEVARLLATSGNNPSEGEGSGEGKPTDPKANPPASDKPDSANPKEPGAEQKAAAKDGENPTQEKQDDIAARATALDKVAATAKGLTGLAKTRIADAAKAANAGADAMGQRDRPGAQKEVDRARENLRVAAKHVAALAAEEAAQQIAAARDLANDVALQTAPSEDRSSGSGSSEKDNKKPSLGSAAEQAKSLKDVLERIAGWGSESAAEAARKVAGLLKQEDLAAAIARLEKPGAGNDRDERHDLAERFAALGQKLDQVYRETIAPRLEELARLEREANELKQKAGAAEDVGEWRRLRQQGAAFLERLEAAGFETLADEDFRVGVGTASVTAGRELFSRGITDAKGLADVLTQLPVTEGPGTVRYTPLWSRGWILGALLAFLAAEWFWRR